MASMSPRKPWRWYVYDIIGHAGEILYVGKGSGSRLAAQRRNHTAAGREVARFKRERDAYAYEIERIAEFGPSRNKHPGGNGPRGTPAPRPTKIDRLCREIGPRRTSARLLLSYDLRGYFSASEVDAIRLVAYGPWC